MPVLKISSHTWKNLEKGFWSSRLLHRRFEYSFKTWHQSLVTESSPKDNFSNVSFLRSIHSSWKPKENSASEPATFSVNGFFMHGMVNEMDFSKVFSQSVKVFQNNKQKWSHYNGFWIKALKRLVQNFKGSRLFVFHFDIPQFQLFFESTYFAKSIILRHPPCLDLFNVFSAVIISHKWEKCKTHVSSWNFWSSTKCFSRKKVSSSLFNSIARSKSGADGVVVRASASQSVNLEFIPLVESYQKTLKNGIHSFPAWRSA